MSLTLLGSANGAGSAAIAQTVPASSGFIIALAYWFPIPGTFTVSDNVNSGNYTQIASWQFPGSVTQWGLFAKQANATGTPTLTMSATDAGEIMALAYSGLNGTLTFPSLDTNHATATGTAVNSGSFNCSVNNEYAIGIDLGTNSTPTGGASSPFGSVIITSGSGNQAIWETSQQFPSGMTAGTAVSLVVSETSDTWLSYVFGFYDLPGAAMTGPATDATSAAGALTTKPAPFAPIRLDDPAHINGSDNIGMGSGPGTGSGDQAAIAFTKLKQFAADVNTMTAQLYPVRSIQTPVTGFSIAAASATQLVLNPAGTLAAGTVTMPTPAADNQSFVLMSSQTITALTLNTSDGSSINGAPTTLSANTSVRFRFMASLNKWFREQ